MIEGASADPVEYELRRPAVALPTPRPVQLDSRPESLPTASDFEPEALGATVGNERQAHVQFLAHPLHVVAWPEDLARAILQQQLQHVLFAPTGIVGAERLGIVEWQEKCRARE